MGDKLDILIRTLVLPFTESELNKKDIFSNIMNTIQDKAYSEKKLSNDFDSLINLLSKSTQLTNLDEVKLYIDKLHIKNMKKYSRKDIYSYYDYLLSLISRIFLTYRDGQICLKYWTSESEQDIFDNCQELQKALMWNSLVRIMSPDILYIKFLLDNNFDQTLSIRNFYNQINLADAQLDNLLSKGIAETHIHIGAATTFYDNWDNLMDMRDRGYLINKLKKDLDILAPSKEFLLNKELLCTMLKKAALMRLYLITCIATPHIIKDGNFTEKYNGVIESNSNFEDLYDKLREFAPALESAKAKEIIFGNKDFPTYDENVFLISILTAFKKDDVYKKLQSVFFMYLRIKNELFKAMTQPNSIKGLDYFQRFFKSSTKVGSNQRRMQKYESALNYAFRNPNIRRIEYRMSFSDEISFEKCVRDTREALYDFFCAYKDLLENNITNTPPAVGIIGSFIKKSDEINKCWLDFNESTDNRHLYFHSIRENYKIQLKAFNYVRDTVPHLAKYLVGIDAASLENNTEPWVFAPLYKEYARSFNKYESTNLNSHTQDLRFTFHVGEEFRDILSGLRHIDEVIEKFGFHSGDRIGHGVILGVNIAKWVDKNKICILPRIEHLENLLWLWGLKTSDGIKIVDEGFIERKIMQIAEEIYENTDGITVYSLWRAYQDKFKEFQIYDLCSKSADDGVCEFVRDGRNITWSKKTLLHSQHCSHYIIRMQEPVIISTNYHDINMYTSLQEYIKSKVNRNGIVIETNPTSNAAIAEIDNIYDHYIFSLNKLNNEGGKSNNVMVTINSDDPSVFNTNITNELSYIYFSLIDKGADREEVLMWIDKIREYNMITCFAKESILDKDEQKNELRQIIDSLK